MTQQEINRFTIPELKSILKECNKDLHMSSYQRLMNDLKQVDVNRLKKIKHAIETHLRSNNAKTK